MDQALRQALQAVEDIESVFADSLPVADAGQLRKVQSACFALRGADAYINEKAAKIERLAAIYFSARRHEQWRGGADGLRAEIRHDLLNRIRHQIDSLDRQGR